VRATSNPRVLHPPGSQGRYYFRPGKQANKFYLHQEGGGFCTDLADCVKRSKTALGSTLPTASDPWQPTLNLSANEPVFSTSASANPLLGDWNHVFMVYCDGAYFSGDNSSRTVVGGTELFFRGRRILDAVMRDLGRLHGLGAATDVVVGGCSAGGIATYAHLDYMSDALTGRGGGLNVSLDGVSQEAAGGLAPGARVVGFADSGFYADVPFFTSQKKKAFAFQAIGGMPGGSADGGTLSARCLSDNAAAPHKCLVAEVNARYIRAPLFAWQSRFDADQLASSLDPPCVAASCAEPYAKHLVDAIERGLFGGGAQQPVHGAFVDGCHRHCDGLPDGGNVMAINATGVTWLQALAQWYEGTAAPGETSAKWLTLQQAAAHYPCASCCGGGS
jgi:hypothetical protein